MDEPGEPRALVNSRPDPGGRIVEVDVESPRDLAECLRLIDAFASVAAGHPGCGFLVTVRDVRFVPSPADALVIANRIYANRGMLDGRAVACVLPRHGDRGTGRVVAVLAQVRGIEMEIFHDADAARVWLQERPRRAAGRSGA